MSAVKCKACAKSIYPMDPQINLDGVKFHKACAKCGDCNCQITISNFTKNESSDQTVLLCKIHYFKRFHEGGSYLGGEKFRVKAARDVNGSSPLPPSASESATPTEEEETPAPKSFYSLPSKAAKSPVKEESKAGEVTEPAASSVFTAVESLKKEEETPSEVAVEVEAKAEGEAAAVAVETTMQEEELPAVEELSLDAESEGVETSTD